MITHLADMTAINSSALSDGDEKCSSYDPQSEPPEFGHKMHKYFGFEEGYVNLNHGSYGSLPLPVSAVCTALSARIERNPDRFLRLDYQALLEDTRSRVANLIGAESVDECVMVPNATHGLNTVLRNFEWHEGDILVGATTTYGAISRVMQYLSDIPPHPTVSTFLLHFPTTHAEIIARFREHLRSLRSASDSESSSTKSKRKIVAVIDAIVSNPGVRLPWAEMVRICKEEGIWSVVDAAHAIGQEVDINLAQIKPDFWVSNCHKWLFAKRGCAVLYVPKRNQHIIKSSVPTSHAYLPPSDPKAPNFVAQFEWTGTIDMVPYLSVPAALEFRNWIGGEHKINAYCHQLALAGGKRLAEILGTSVMKDEKDELVASMINVELPLSGVEPSTEVDTFLRTQLLLEGDCYAGHFFHNGKWWARCSAQVWGEVSDFECVGKVFASICKQLRQKYGKY